MKTKAILFVFIMTALMKVNAQPSDLRKYFVADSLLIHNWYTVSASEIIFSGGNVTSGGQSLDNVVRFTAFFHIQQQYHYNFNNTFGFFTGFGLRNVGFINKFPVGPGYATVKQRSYSIGVPLALKIGSMRDGAYLALGAEAEWMFAYKEKILYNDQKYKYYQPISHWFSDAYVNVFNPSLFADIRFHSGSYIRFKYYLVDFLRDEDMSFTPPESATKVIYQPTSSKLFYVAIGTAFRERKHKKHHETKTEV